MNRDIEGWKQELLADVSYQGQPGGMNFYLNVFNESLARRFIQVLEECFSAYTNDHYLCAYMNLRTLIETLAVSFHLKKLVDENSQIHINDLKRLAFGGRLEHFEIKQTNIQTILNKIFKLHPVLEDTYNMLCEFMHPNYMGVAGAFSDLDSTGDVAHLFSTKECIKRSEYFSMIESVSSYMYTLYVDTKNVLKEKSIAKVSGFEEERERHINISLTVDKAEFLISEIEVHMESFDSEPKKKLNKIKKTIDGAIKKKI